MTALHELKFVNYDKTPTTEIIYLPQSSVTTVIAWYEQCFKWHRYSIAIDGVKLNKDANCKCLIPDEFQAFEDEQP